MQVTCRSHAGHVQVTWHLPPAGTCLLHHADGCSGEQSFCGDLPQHLYCGRERVRFRVLQAALLVPGRQVHRPLEGTVHSPPELLDEGECWRHAWGWSACKGSVQMDGRYVRTYVIEQRIEEVVPDVNSVAAIYQFSSM